jgi:hypothetical protein
MDKRGPAFTVLGVGITAEQRDAALAVMHQPFVAMQVEGAFMRAGVPRAEGIAMRAADRLIQSERKAGRIKFRAGQWWPTSANV